MVLAAFAFSPLNVCGQTEGDYLYNITMLRAAPGHFTDLVSALEESFVLHEEAGDQAPFWIRHSQGDHWDFMLIYPMGDYFSYYSLDRIEQRTSVWESSRGQMLVKRISEFTSYQEEWFSRSSPVDELARRFEGMGFFHVEPMVVGDRLRMTLSRPDGASLEVVVEVRHCRTIGPQTHLIGAMFVN